MSDLDLMEPETEQAVVLADSAETPQSGSDAATDPAWPREQMLDRLRTCD
ncbi:MAG: hypothetical protein ACXU8O_01220 [Asticcacaulis sp.]